MEGTKGKDIAGREKTVLQVSAQIAGSLSELADLENAVYQPHANAKDETESR